MADGPTIGGGPAFERHAAVWTGNRMLVWFGREAAVYDPATDQWQNLPSWPEDGRQVFPRATWTGNELLVWGGWLENSTGPGGITDVGYILEPSPETWQPLPAGPMSGRDDHTST